MTGRKQFDEDQVLDAAMRAFWREGYQATSVAELEAATGLNKSSLYNSYGSKEGLYEQCLERFGQRYGSQLIGELDHADFKSSVRGFFGLLVKRLEDSAIPDGCFVTMAAMEVGGDGSSPAKSVELNLETVRAAFARRCAKAVRDSQLPAGTDCQALAAMLLAMTRGIAVLNRGHSNPEVVRAAVRGVLCAIDLASGDRKD